MTSGTMLNLHAHLHRRLVLAASCILCSAAAFSLHLASASSCLLALSRSSQSLTTSHSRPSFLRCCFSLKPEKNVKKSCWKLHWILEEGDRETYMKDAQEKMVKRIRTTDILLYKTVVLYHYWWPLDAYQWFSGHPMIIIVIHQESKFMVGH